MVLKKFTVAGPADLRDDETKQDVAPGGVVGLDDAIEGRNIAALVQSGHIKPVDEAKPVKKPEKQE